MKGTNFFSRMNYSVRRGFREIVAPTHKIALSDWEEILAEFSGQCAYCGSGATAENRGIVPDHLIAVTAYGELVPGNTVPACQTCNDSRGNKDWREFLEARNPLQSLERANKIDAHVERHKYLPTVPQNALTPDELSEYELLLGQWEEFLRRAKHLRDVVNLRRSGK